MPEHRGGAGERAGTRARVAARSPTARRTRGGAATREPGPALRTPFAAVGRGPLEGSGAAAPAAGEGRAPGQRRGRPGTGEWKERGEGPQASGLQQGPVHPAAGALAGVDAVRAVTGPGHLKEQCTWVSKACGRGIVFLPPGWHLMGAQSCRPVAPGPGSAWRGQEGRRRSSRVREEQDLRSGLGDSSFVIIGIWPFYQAFTAARRLAESSF